MKEGRPSQTAAFVAVARALADGGLTHVRDFRDPTARVLLPRSWEAVLFALRSFLRRAPPRMLDWALARLDLFPLRTAAIDEEVRLALEAGCTQLVILGAGLDGRAYRMEALSTVRVFEVDHPSTQGLKRARATTLRRRCRDLVYVPVDFEHDALGEALARHGHRADAPTAWIWEGVTMYLTDAALRSTLRVIGGRSAPSSRVLIHYHDHIEDTREVKAVGWLTSFVAEPLVGGHAPEAMETELRGCGAPGAP